MSALDAFWEEFLRVEEGTNNGDGFDTDGEDVGGEIAGVGESIFLPELGKERVFAGDGCAVEDVVPYMR